MASKDKIRRWCALRERSRRDVQEKMRLLGILEGESKKWISELEEEGYISESRFVEAYVRTHLEHKRWGPYRISAGLHQKGINSEMIARGLSAIQPEAFARALDQLITARASDLPEKRDRLIRFLQGRGFELNAILKALAVLKQS